MIGYAPAKARCAVCGFWVHTGQPIVTQIARDRHKTLIVMHKDCAR